MPFIPFVTFLKDLTVLWKHSVLKLSEIVLITHGIRKVSSHMTFLYKIEASKIQSCF